MAHLRGLAHNVTDDILSQVASLPDRVLRNSSLLDRTLLRKLGCSFTQTDIHTGEIRTYPPLQLSTDT
jgi:hypothetical protein